MELQETRGKQSPGRKPGQRRRSPLEIARDRSLIVDLRLMRRKTLQEIADIVSAQYLEEIADQETGLDKDGKRPPSVMPRQVRVELEKSVEDYKETRAEEIHAKRLELIRRYDRMSAFAFEEYDKSAVDRVTTMTEETSSAEHGSSTKERETTEQRPTGDKGFLSIAVTCIDRIAELEAVIPPRKTALTNPEGTEPFKFEEPEELKRLGALAKLLTAPGNGSDVIDVEVISKG